MLCLIRSRRRASLTLAILGVVLLGASACSDGESELAAGGPEASDVAGADDGPPISLGSVPTTTLPSCSADAVGVPDDWPFVVSAALVPTATSVADFTYSVTGITNDPERVIVDSIEHTFPDFTSEEPTGDATNVHLEFSSSDSGATLDMSDGDGDGCWDVGLSATYPDTPPPAAAGSGEPSSTSVADASDDLAAVNAAGQGEVITARGTYQLTVTRCDVSPLAIEASAPEGELAINGDGDAVRVVWVYGDGVEISDDEARVMGFDETSGTIVADGEGPNGEETVIVDFVCS